MKFTSSRKTNQLAQFLFLIFGIVTVIATSRAPDHSENKKISIKYTVSSDCADRKKDTGTAVLIGGSGVYTMEESTLFGFPTNKFVVEENILTNKNQTRVCAASLFSSDNATASFICRDLPGETVACTISFEKVTTN